jgi:hypothetical protein
MAYLRLPSLAILIPAVLVLTVCPLVTLTAADSPAREWQSLQAQVVDAQTGEPVKHFAVQTRCPTSDPSNVTWCGMTWSQGGSRDGKFGVGREYVVGDNVEFRIIAEGYVPKVVSIPLKDGRLAEPPVVKFERGVVIRGRVLDHEGRPVAGAKVLVSGPTMISITNGEIEGPGGVPQQTDAEGRFSVTGLDLSGGTGEALPRVIVLAPGVHAWAVPVVPTAKEITIRLPEPASLKIRYDIPGADEEAEFRLELKTWTMPDWQGVQSVQIVKAPNGGEVTVSNLPPGAYDFARSKLVRVGDRGEGALLDRRSLELQGGQTAAVSVVRTEGQVIEGEVVGLPADTVPGAFVEILAAPQDGGEIDDIKTPRLDEVATGTGGSFRTSLIPPGTYLIKASAYEPEPRDGVFVSGIRLPSYTGSTMVTIEAGGRPVHVRIEMKSGGGPPVSPASH